jgi:hypothetical protein
MGTAGRNRAARRSVLPTMNIHPYAREIKRGFGKKEGINAMLFQRMTSLCRVRGK